MAKIRSLTKREKFWFVGQYAMYRSTVEVIKAFAEQPRGFEVSRQRAEQYNAGNPAAREELSRELQDYYDRVRERYKAAIEDIPIALARYRLEQYQAMLESELIRPTPSKKTLLAILEQAAKDAGGAFTNKQELSGPGGAPIPVSQTSAPDLSRLKDLTPEERQTLLELSEKMYAGAAAGSASA